MIENRSHNTVTTYFLCRVFGWTPNEIYLQSAKDIEGMLYVHNTIKDLSKQISSGDDKAKTILVTED